MNWWSRAIGIFYRGFFARSVALHSSLNEHFLFWYLSDQTTSFHQYDDDDDDDNEDEDDKLVSLSLSLVEHIADTVFDRAWQISAWIFS